MVSLKSIKIPKKGSDEFAEELGFFGGKNHLKKAQATVENFTNGEINSLL